MALDGYLRFIARGIELVCRAVVGGASLMWVATVADHVLRLHWGWVIQIIWLPIMVGWGLLILLVSRIMLVDPLD